MRPLFRFPAVARFPTDQPGEETQSQSLWPVSKIIRCPRFQPLLVVREDSGRFEGAKRRKSITAGLATQRSSDSSILPGWYRLNERENAFFGEEFNYPASELSTHFPAHYDLILYPVPPPVAFFYRLFFVRSGSPYFFVPFFFGARSDAPATTRTTRIEARVFRRLLSRVLAVSS